MKRAALVFVPAFALLALAAPETVSAKSKAYCMPMPATWWRVP